MIKEWAFGLDDVPKRELYMRLLDSANAWCNAELPRLVQVADPTQAVEGAKLADRLMYQLRQGVAAVLVMVGSLGGDADTTFDVRLWGIASSDGTAAELRVHAFFTDKEDAD